MTAYRALFKAMEKIQIDVKYLIDIPNIYQSVYFKQIPKYQITAWDYKSGVTFIGFSYTKDSTSMGIFVAVLVSYLIKAGVDVSKLYFQSDNGSEFRQIDKKHGYTLYEEVLRSYGIRYKFVRVKSPTSQSDVESFHLRIEKEFYNIESIQNETELFYKSLFYMTWYNNLRPNRNKDHKAPAEILKDYEINNVEALTTIPPIFVDKYVKKIELVKKEV